MIRFSVILTVFFVTAFAYGAIAEDIPSNTRNVLDDLIVWSSDMKTLPVGASVSPTITGVSTGIDATKGVLYMSGPNRNVTTSAPDQPECNLQLGQSISAPNTPYLRMRVRVTKDGIYNIRPMDSTGKKAWPDNVVGFVAPALEQRTGLWDETNDPNGGWEELTFNLDSYTRLHETQVNVFDRLIMRVGFDKYVAVQPATLKMEVDSITFHKGILPTQLLTSETIFDDGLDNDCDGKVDRDDDDFNVYRLRKVMPVYQTMPFMMNASYYLTAADGTKTLLYSGRWGGWRTTAGHNRNNDTCRSGACANCTFLNPDLPLGKAKGKRAIKSTSYPLDYTKFPNDDYEVENYTGGVSFNEHIDQTIKGIWPTGGAGVQSPAPTDQFTNTPIDYEALGAFEEYDISNESWLAESVKLARRFGADGFAMNDAASYLGTEPYVNLMTNVIKNLNAASWKDNRFLFASLYAFPTGTSESTGNDLNYMGTTRPAKVGVDNYLNYMGRPVVFLTPTDYVSGGATLSTPEDWDAVFAHMLKGSDNFHGSLKAPHAVPNARNLVRLRFDKCNSSGYTARIDDMILYDKDMNIIEQVDVGSEQARADNLTTVFGNPEANGWAHDAPVKPGQDYSFSYARDKEYASQSRRPRSVMQMYFPKYVKYMKVKVLAYEGGYSVSTTTEPICLPQWVELAILPSGTSAADVNGGNAFCGIRFPVTGSWQELTFRVDDLPEGFDQHGYVPGKLTELPVSVWGDIPPIVNRYDKTDNYTSGLQGYASYVSNDTRLIRDARTQVNYPYLQSGTVRPAFDDSGFYHTPGDAEKRFYYQDPQDGKRMRLEFEYNIKYGVDNILVTSWNEWGEGTNVEPEIERGYLRCRLMLTYALYYREQMITGKWPSATGLTVHRFDRDGTARNIKFKIAGADTVTFKNLPFTASPNIIVKRNGVLVASGLSSGNRWQRTGNNVSLTEMGSAAATWEISYGAEGVMFTVTPGSQSVPEEGGTYTATVTSVSSDISWSAKTNVTWIRLVNGSGTGTGVLTYTVTPNSSIVSRSGIIEVGSSALVVTQCPRSASITVSPARFDVIALTNQVKTSKLTVKKNGVSVGYSVVCEAPWLSATPDEAEDIAASGNEHDILFDASKLTAGANRTGDIKIYMDNDANPAVIPVTFKVADANNLQMLGADFTPNAPVACEPGSQVSLEWQVGGTAESLVQYWLEMIPSKSGGFATLRSGQTATDSTRLYSYEGPLTVKPTSAKVRWLPDGIYTLCAYVNRSTTGQIAETNYADNRLPIPRKRLYVRNTQIPVSDLTIVNSSVSRDNGVVKVRATVRNDGTGPISTGGCWIEAMYGNRNFEGHFTVSGYMGGGQVVSSLAPGETVSFERSANVSDSAVLAVMVDSTDMVPETNEKNNFVLFEPNASEYFGDVDVEVLDASISAGQVAPVSLDPSAGTMLNWSVTLRNNSDVTAERFYVELFPSQTGGLSLLRSGTTICSSPRVTLAPGETKTFGFSQKLNLLSDGIYSAVVIANRKGVSANTSDFNPRNNAFTISMRLVLHNATMAQADLTIPESSFNLTRNGNSVVISGSCVNAGSQTAGTSWIEAWYGRLDSAGAFSGEGVIGSGGVSTGELAPGSSKAFTLSGTVPPDKVIGVCADVTDIVPEMDETNNYLHIR